MTDAAAGTIVIRDVRPEEYAETGALLVEAYRSAGLESEDGYLEHIRDVAHRSRAAQVLVAVDGDGRILGSVTYVDGPDNAYAETERPGDAGVRMLGVRPEARGRGIGQALMDACIERARADGRDRLVLVTTGVFKHAARLYLRNGFRRARERDFAPEPSIHLRGYELDLRAGS